MGYHTSNAAYAYDMQSVPTYEEPGSGYVANPAVQERPQLNVLTGAGREANQAVSPVFTHVVKTFAILATVFIVIGLGRVTLASATAAVLDANAATTASIESAQTEIKDLEVMRSVYGSETRIRDLAAGYGMVEAEGSVTLDFSSDNSADDASSSSTTETASTSEAASADAATASSNS